MLAGREVRRAKLRFGLLSGAVGLLVFLILFQQALLGSLLLSFTGALENQSGTVLVFSEEARKNISGSVILPPQQAQIESVAGIGAAAPLGETTLTIEAGGDDTDASVFGFQPGGPGEPTRVVEGRLPASPTEAVASREDESIGFGLGDTVVSVDGDISLTIVGLTERSRFSVAPTIWVTFDGYVALRKASNPDATAVLPSVIAITPAEGVSAADLAAAIDDQVDGVQALTRSQAVNEAPGVSSVNTSFQLILGLAFLVVAVVIGFFFLILTVQKQSTLTVLRAVGAPTSYLVKALLTQIALVVGVGIVLGGLLTYGAVKGASTGLPISIEPGTLALTALGVVLLSLVGSAFTLLRVTRIDPADVMNRQNAGGLRMKLGLVELRRKPLRFAIAGSSLVLLSVLLLFLGGLLDGLFIGSTGLLRSQQGELIVYSSDAKDSLIRSRIDPDVRAQVEAVDGVAATGGLGVALVGGEVAGETDLVNLSVTAFELPVDGMPADVALGADQALADRSLEAFGVKVGETVLVGSAQTPIDVVGWVSDTNFLQQGGFFVAPDTWRQVLAESRPDSNLPPETFQALVVEVADGADVATVAQAIDDATAGATSTLTRDEAVQALPGIKEQNSTFSAIIYVTLFVAGLVVALFFALLTLERIGLYSVLKAVGASSRQIFGGVVLQAVLVALISFVVGGLLMLLLTLVLPAEIPVAVLPARGLQIAVGLVVMSALGAAVSLRRVVRVDPASAIG